MRFNAVGNWQHPFNLLNLQISLNQFFEREDVYILSKFANYFTSHLFVKSSMGGIYPIYKNLSTKSDTLNFTLPNFQFSILNLQFSIVFPASSPKTLASSPRNSTLSWGSTAPPEITSFTASSMVISSGYTLSLGMKRR